MWGWVGGRMGSKAQTLAVVPSVYICTQEFQWVIWESKVHHRGCQMGLGARDCEVGWSGNNARTSWVTLGYLKPHVCTLASLAPPHRGPQ